MMLDQKKSSKNKKDLTAAETAFYRRNISLKIADGLEDSASAFIKKITDGLEVRTPETENFVAETLAVADCMRETASDENIYYSFGQINSQTGERFDGYGSLTVAVGTRIDPSHQAKQSSRWSNKIREAFNAHHITDDDGSLLVRDDDSLKNFDLGVRLRFLTLSMPELKCSADCKLLILTKALVLFKKRDVWKNAVLGAYLSEEFTDGEASYFRWNFHAHALLVSKWIDQEFFASNWTDCVIEACKFYKVEFPDFDTKGNPINHLHVWINDVATYAKRNEMSLRKAIFEVSKYSCKGSDILNVPVEELGELRRTLHGRRLVESYGIFNNNKGKSIEQLEREAIRAEGCGESTETENLPDEPLLDNKSQLTPQASKETLIRIGTRMILEGKRAEWLDILREKMEKRRAFRRRQLIELYPDAIFYTLDGENFSGSDFVRPEFENVSPFVALAG